MVKPKPVGSSMDRCCTVVHCVPVVGGNSSACVQGGGSVSYWVAAVDARNREYAQLMRKFQVEANLHDAAKRSLSEQIHTRHKLQVWSPSACGWFGVHQHCTGRSTMNAAARHWSLLASVGLRVQLSLGNCPNDAGCCRRSKIVCVQCLQDHVSLVMRESQGL